MSEKHFDYDAIMAELRLFHHNKAADVLEYLLERAEDNDFELGFSFGAHVTSDQARAAASIGEIDLWLKYQEPKTIQEWAEWNSEYGEDEEFEKRWKSK